MPILTEPNLHQTEVYQALQQRLQRLTPVHPAQWGKMDVAQMLAHVTANLELAMGSEKVKQTLEGRLFGKVAKRKILRDGLPRGVATDAKRKITDRRDFFVEKERLEQVLKQFFQSGETGVTREPHDFFGRMTAPEWARLQYLHTDHHFRQFGV